MEREPRLPDENNVVDNVIRIDKNRRIRERIIIQISDLDHDIALFKLKVKALQEERDVLARSLKRNYGEEVSLTFTTDDVS